MQGSFKYNGLNIRYKFKIIRYINSEYLGECQIWYRTSLFQLISNGISFDESSNYKSLLNKYKDMTNSELSKIIEPLIKSEIGYKILKNRFK